METMKVQANYNVRASAWSELINQVVSSTDFYSFLCYFKPD